jgi:GDP-L-fucose synthase
MRAIKSMEPIQYLTPCNLYGEHDKFGENSHFVAALIKKIHEAKLAGEDKITLFGTGTPLRQFMHSNDLAAIIRRCIYENIYDSFNVATDQNVSIDDIARTAIRACKADEMRIEYDATKPDGQFRKDVSTDKMKSIFNDFKPTRFNLFYFTTKLETNYLIIQI